MKFSFVLGLLVVLSSFTRTGNDVNNAYLSTENNSGIRHAFSDVIITFDQSDVCGLNYLGEVSATERGWFHNNNNIKEETLATLKKQTLEKGGNIVFINIKEQKGFGFFYSTKVVGYVYQK